MTTEPGDAPRATDTEETTEAERARWWAWVAWEALALSFIVVLAFSVGMAHLRNGGQRSTYLLQYYGPSVMIALHRGFVAPDTATAPAIGAFLQLKQDELTLDSLPESIPERETDQFQRIHLYSMYVVGLFWRILGIRWRALDPLHALFFAVACSFAYGLLRLAARRTIAAPCALLIVFSPLALYMLPQFRDFSKMPFVLGTLFFLGVAISVPMGRYKFLTLSAVLGAILGFGLGFRQDLLLYVPGSLVLLFGFTPGPWKRTWPRRLLACAVLPAVFVATAWPILMAMSGGTNGAHNIALGLTEDFDERMNVGGAPYAMGHLYLDAYMHTRISSHAMQRHGRTASAPYWSGVYEKAGRQFLFDVYRAFPADFLTRWYASVERILEDAPFVLDDFYPVNARLESLHGWRTRFLGGLSGWGVLLTALTAVLLAIVNARWALAFVFVLLYFVGYSSLQFSPRHYFPFELAFLWVAAFLMNALTTGVAGLVSNRRRKAWMNALRRPAALKAPLWRLCGVAVMVVLVLGGPVAACRAWQHYAVGWLYRAYAEAARTPLVTEVTIQGTAALIRPAGFLPPESATPLQRDNRVQDGLLVAEIGPSPYAFPLVLRYQADTPVNAFNDLVTVPESGTNAGPRLLFLPVFQTTDSYFGLGQRRLDALAVPKGCEAFIARVYQVDEPGRLPLLLTMLLPENTDTAPTGLRRLPGPPLDKGRARPFP